MRAPVRGPIDVVLPAHNEGECLGDVLREFHQIVTVRDNQEVRFVVCEDGSTDDTVAIVEEAAQTLPILLLSCPERKGYSRAVIDGFRATQTSLVAFVDSDGQCDPRDFPSFLAAIPEADLVLGYRNPRNDPWARKLFSRAFGLVYRFLFPVSVRDPSCPFLLIRRQALDEILSGNVGILKQGFWWEFLARAQAAGLAIREVPVTHRKRLRGDTRVYRPRKIPRIALEHLFGLWRLRRDLKGSGR